MKKDIILAGVGGQGILSIATIIGYAVIESGYNLKQSEVHGMSQRGGDVQSHLRISDNEIYSDLIPLGNADMILAVEPMEALRFLPYLAPAGWLITNTKTFENIPDYPEKDKIITEIEQLKNKVALDADGIAKELGTTKVMNMVMLGAASEFLELEYSKLEEGIKSVFGRKGEKIVETNLKAMAAGKKIAQEKK
ncbi:MAG TPA: indolepyruvate oxidoreductase subunit beta [Candidatus Cloacimonas sp.]|jgi:indolepyruvate ferredoxin oxidoreductase beta subunit|nr:indolepyruvate ferredoxin oxidoreductase, beta subunit [Candidatus Cloacimonadota bacterium]HCX74033.1 indolepyruvate oxidoreductase subunit beta [Candidatus Cloacimonas sp.]